MKCSCGFIAPCIVKCVYLSRGGKNPGSESKSPPLLFAPITWIC
uniref:Uncharacterized protein n=1 Tax=Anguilla anguilla TaxID=7936 RepID=A0A0E9R6R6_ANGAN